MATEIAENDLLEVGDTTSYCYQLSAKPDAKGTVLEIDWTGVPNRNPSTSGDFVALWQNNGSIPFGTAAKFTQNVTNTTPDGSIPFSGLALAKLPYVAAYCVGSDNTSYKNVAAAIPIGAGGVPGTPQPTTLSVGYVGSTSLILDYNTPIGSTPKTFGHQIVLVAGQTYVPGTTKAVATTSPSDNQSDAATFTGVTMVSGQWYTGAYLAGANPANVAATVTFQVT